MVVAEVIKVWEVGDHLQPQQLRRLQLLQWQYLWVVVALIIITTQVEFQPHLIITIIITTITKEEKVGMTLQLLQTLRMDIFALPRRSPMAISIFPVVRR